MKVIDAHTHFKEKFLKILTEKEIRKYLNSEVEYMIGVIDFFPINWKDIVKEISILLHCHIRGEYKSDIAINIIENLLWEEIDYSKGEINIRELDKKLVSKIFSNSNIKLKTLLKPITKLSNFILPAPGAERFIKNVEQEIVGLKVIRNKHNIKSYLCIGIHPLAIGDIGDFDKVRKVLKRFRTLIKKNKYIIGIGECGIEDNTAFEKRVLHETLLLGKELGTPVVIHTPLTHGRIPADRKLKGICDICNIVKKTKININQITFDHITDIECVGIINKKFPGNNKPYISFSLQEHWIDAEEVARLTSIIRNNWGNNIMVNSDFGTHQTPEAFTLLKRQLKNKNVPEESMAKILYGNAFRFFGIKRIKNEFNSNITKKYDVVIDFNNINNSLDALLALKKIENWLLPAYSFKQIAILSSRWTKVIMNYFHCIGNKNIKIVDAYRQKKNSIFLDMTPKLDFAQIYEKIDKQIGNLKE